MSKKFNNKSIIVVIIAMIIGVYIILFEKQIIAGFAIIAGGIALNFLEVVKWITELVKFFKSFSKGGEETETEKPANNNTTNVVQFGDNTSFHGDTAIGGSKIDKK